MEQLSIIPGIRKTAQRPGIPAMVMLRELAAHPGTVLNAEGWAVEGL